jgi:hypothetical protein
MFWSISNGYDLMPRHLARRSVQAAPGFVARSGMSDARNAAFAANAAAGGLPDSARFAALAAGQAAAVPHVAAHDLGAAAYAIKAAMAAALPDDAESARLRERDWQRDQLPEDVRQLVIDDQRQRDDICWNVFRE